MKLPWLLRRLICELSDHDHRTETSEWCGMADEVTWCVRCGYVWPPR